MNVQSKLEQENILKKEKQSLSFLPSMQHSLIIFSFFSLFSNVCIFLSVVYLPSAFSLFPKFSLSHSLWTFLILFVTFALLSFICFVILIQYPLLPQSPQCHATLLLAHLLIFLLSILSFISCFHTIRLFQQNFPVDQNSSNIMQDLK